MELPIVMIRKGICPSCNGPLNEVMDLGEMEAATCTCGAKHLIQGESVQTEKE